MSLESKASRLIDRSDQLKKVRSFFDKRCVYEVDTPLLVEYPNLDTHIELFKAYDGYKERYLHTSPEFGMKRLLSILKKDIYQLSHVFRACEFGSKHNPEFMMIEWYRIGKNLEFLIEETVELIKLFIEPKEIESLSYFDLFKRETGIDLLQSSDDDLTAFLNGLQIDYPITLNFYEKVDFIFSFFVEPNLKELTIVKGFPEWQKALAKVKGNQAMRFEIYYGSIELANGYDELLDPQEQKRRFLSVIEERDQQGKSPFSIDDRFLSALPLIPECSGVAVGFDRLMMIRHQAKKIGEVIPFDYSEI